MRVFAAFVAVLLSCDAAPGAAHSGPAPAGSNVALGGQIAARVGSDAVPLSLVADVAKAQGVDPIEAALRTAYDAVLANAAHERGLDTSQPTAWLLLAAQARRVADHTFDEAKRRGPPDDDEVRALSQRHWAEVDRPATVRTVHALVRPKDPSESQAARRLAERVRDAVRSVDAAAFEATARAILGAEGQKLEFRVEGPLPAVTEAGLIPGGGAMDPAFARAAAALANPGDTSDVVESSFGFHVIRLLERLPERRMPFEQRRLAFAEEVYSLRAHELLAARVGELRATHPVTISPAAENLMRGISLASGASLGGPP